MKLKKLQVSNFGSYRHFEFDFENLGLSLIYGPTGSGKSTICDMACWILFGITAKEGNADEVRNWQALEEITEGTLVIEINGSEYVVTRRRGRGANDLFWFEQNSTDPTRGKDLTETQKLLSERLGISSDLYLAGAYFSEFSPTGRFFLAKAKDRRSVFENFTNLSFPISLAEKATEAKKATKVVSVETETALIKTTGMLEAHKAAKIAAIKDKNLFDQTKEKAVARLESLALTFDQDKQAKIDQLQKDFNAWNNDVDAKVIKAQDRIEEFTARIVEPNETLNKIADLKGEIEGLDLNKCPTCGAITESPDHKPLYDRLYELEQSLVKNQKYLDCIVAEDERILELKMQINPYGRQLEAAKNMVNCYDEEIAIEKTKSNPFFHKINDLDHSISETDKKVRELTRRLNEFKARLSSLSQLYDLSFELRSELLYKSVKEIQDKTNYYLETYFDSIIRVSFELKGSDDLEVGIFKNGYECVYRQLSKGQRQLLKLCFVVSVMEASANEAGIHFDTLFFDEALDGLDSELKAKAFGLFQELSTRHASILLIEHEQQFQNLFSRRFKVDMIEDKSEVTDET